MRLRLFDRIRRLTRSRRPAVDKASGVPGAQGRHRRGSRRGPSRPARAISAAPGEWSNPVGPPGALAQAASPAPDDWPRPEVPFAPGPSPARGGPAGTRPDPGSRRGSGAGRVPGPPAVRAGAARARIREVPQDAAPVGVGEAARPTPAAPGPRSHRHEAVAPGLAHAAGARPKDLADTRAVELTHVAVGVPRQPRAGGRSSLRAAGAALRIRLPFAAPHPRERPPTADGRRNCGSLEKILWRQWDTVAPLPAEVIAAVDRLAELPEPIKERLADGLDAIFIGPGGVPELDDMTSLRGVPLPAGRATWDACAGAYGERKIVVGSQPSPTPDVMCHEVGHALDDLDSQPGKWQSDSAEFRILYDRCQPHLASDFHRQPGGLLRGRVCRDRVQAAAGPRGHAERGYTDCAKGHAVLQQALWHLG